ncbi:MAG: hypothetical protein ACX931_06255 [Saccharospirillum sp.]
MTDASDVEIYIADVQTRTVEQWLSDQLHQFTALPRQKGMMKNATCYQGVFNDTPFTVMILERVIASFTSVWIDSNASPWPDDKSCARAAAAHFQKDVRIAAGLWQENDDPDAWISVAPDGTESAIRWQTT